MAATSTSPEFSREEVGLALRNPGMQLEGLRYPITPTGMHYLLIHFDIPHVDPSTYTLPVTGRVRNPLELSLQEIKSRPKITMPVMMECGGNGRAHLSPRAISAPWHDEAVGCAEWTGTSLRPILEEAGILDDAVEVVFSGHDRGIDQGVEHDYERSLTVEEALRDEVFLAYEMNGVAASSAARLPAPARRARLVRHGVGQVAKGNSGRGRAFRRHPAGRHVQLPPVRRRPRHTRNPQAPPRPHGPTRHPELSNPRAARRGGYGPARRPRLVRFRPRREGRVQPGWRRDLGRRTSR